MTFISNTDLKIKPVQTKKELRTFIMLPFEIHKNHKLWVPPLLYEEWDYFDQRKNQSFQKNDTILLLAYQDNKAIGRILGIINHRRNSRLMERNACFGYLECYDDPVVAKRLLETVEDWAVKIGMDKLVGPMGFSDQDPEGYLIEGFEFEPTLATYYNFSYLPQLIEKSGYSKVIDYVVYQIDLSKPLPELYKRIVDRLLNKGKFEFIDFKKKKKLRPYIKPVLQLMNETFADLYGYDPLTDEEISAIGKKFLPVIDPRFVKVGLKDNRLVAFLLGIPNLNYGFRKAKGKLFPFGLIHFIRAPRKTSQLDLMLGGISSDFRGIGLDAYGMMKIIEAARAAGYSVMDSHSELETNLKVRNEMERLGGRLYKRFRIYNKQLL